MPQAGAKFSHVDRWTLRFSVGGNLRQHRHCLLRIFTDRRLTGKHYSIRTVEDRVSNVGRLGPGRQAADRHRFEHLRCSDDWLAGDAGSGDELFLQDRHLLDRNFYAKVAARHHDAVTCVQDIIEVPDGVYPFYFGDEEGLLAGRIRCGAHSFHVTASLHERLAHGVHSLLQRKLQTSTVVLGKGTDSESDSGQIQALFGTQFATHRHLAVNFAACNTLDRQLPHTVVQEESFTGFHDSRQALEAHLHALRSADDLFHCQYEAIVGMQFN